MDALYVALSDRWWGVDDSPALGPRGNPQPRPRLLPCLALLCALLYMAGVTLQRDDIQGQTEDGVWHSLVTYEEIHDGDGDVDIRDVIVVLGAPLLVMTALWLWGPRGGNIGRLLFSIAFTYVLYGLVTTTDIVSASLGDNHWSSQLLGGTRPTEPVKHFNDELGRIVAYREMIDAWAGLMLWSLIGGVVLCGVSYGQSLLELLQRIRRSLADRRLQFCASRHRPNG